MSIYTRDDLETDLDWFNGLGVDEQEAKEYIKSLLEKNMDTSVYDELKRVD